MSYVANGRDFQLVAIYGGLEDEWHVEMRNLFSDSG